MHEGGLLYQAFIFLLATVVSVPIAKRLGFGSVLGYLIAGVVIGPYALELVAHDVKSIMHFAEFGVVMMLFLVGLELRPSLLWNMRKPILGLGGLQMFFTCVAFYVIGIALDFPWQSSLAVGLILAMSSTAIVLQTLSEKNLMPTEAGQSAFAVLLFQDIAVIPMLALLPLLALDTSSSAAVSGHLEGWQQGLLVIGVVAAIIIGSWFVINPLFRVIASTKLREIFTATALCLVIGIALLMELAGLSAALGTFIAGVVLAESEYRHELEAEIQPFKGLLLGVFFISVGASIDFKLLLDQPLLIASLVLTLVVVKLLVLFVLAKSFKLQRNDQWMFTFALAQGGEFCFVLFSFATQNDILPVSITAPLMVVVALSMALTPVLMIVNDKVFQRLIGKPVEEKPEADKIDDGTTEVIIAGFGRFGQVVDRSLSLNGVSTTVLDNDPGQVEQLRKFGHKVFYGDPSRLDLLHAAGAGTAKLLVIAVNDYEKCKTMVHLCKKHFPELKLYVRAADRVEAHELNRMGVDVFVRETFHSALHMSWRVMTGLGKDPVESRRVLDIFKKFDQKHIYDMHDFDGDEKAYISLSQKNKAELEKVLRSDSQSGGSLEKEVAQGR